MKKFLKISLISLAVVLLLLLTAPFLFKGKIIELAREEANKTLNAKLNFSDDIGISLIRNFPNLSLSVNELSITEIDSFENDTLVYLPELKLTLDLMSVIKGDKMEIKKVYLNDAFINLQVLKSGKANWDIAKSDTTSVEETDTSASSFSLGLQKLEIENAHLIYNDESMGFSTELESLNHTLSGDFTLDEFILQTQTRVEKFSMSYDGVAYLSDVKTDIDADMNMNMKDMKFTFAENSISLNELKMVSQGFIDMNDDDMEFDLKFKTESAEFKHFLSLIPAIFMNDFAALKAGGKLALGGYLKGKMTETAMPGFGVDLNIDNGSFQYPDLPKSLKGVFVDLKVDNPDGEPDHTLINLKRFDALVAGEPIKAALLAKNPISNPYIDGFLKGKINLDDYRSMIPLETTTELKGLIESNFQFKGFVNELSKQNTDAFDASGYISASQFHYKDPENLPRGVDLNSKVNFSMDKVELENLSGTHGMSDFALKGEINNLPDYIFHDELLSGSFDLKSNYFNANEFLTEETVEKEPEVTDTIALEAFEVPGNIDFEFSSSINKLVYDNLNMSDLKGKIIARDSRLLFEKLGMNIFGGSLSMDGAYDSKNPKFPFSEVDFKVQSLSITEAFNSFEMVQAMMPIAQYTSGLFNAGIELKNNFNPDLSVAYPTVSGVINMGIAEAALKDMPILQAIGEKLKIDKFKNLSLKNLNFKMNILDGKVMLDSMLVPLWTGAKAKISGYTALDQTIQYVARLSIPRKDFGAANTALNSLTDQAKSKGLNLDVSEMVDVDVIIGGLFSKPDVKVSLHDAKNSIMNGIKDQITGQINQKKEEAEAEARQKAEELKQKTTDSLNRIKQKAIDDANARKKAVQDSINAVKEREAQRLKEEADKQKKKALDGLKDKFKK